MKPKNNTLLKEYAMMVLAVVMISTGVYFFKFPNHFSIGGVSGLSILLDGVIHLDWFTPALCNTVINIFFLLVGFLLLGKDCGARTVACCLGYSGLMQVFEAVFPLSAPLTDQPLLELFFAVMLPALGSAILFNINASTGGTEILALILKKYSGLDVGRALLCSDVLIAAGALVVFDATAGLCALLGLVLKSVLVDTTIESLNRRKAFFVITASPDVACRFITGTLGRGATLWNTEGAYTGNQTQMVLTVLSRRQAVQLRRYLKEHDPAAFMIVTNSSEIFGNGFLRA